MHPRRLQTWHRSRSSIFVHFGFCQSGFPVLQRHIQCPGHPTQSDRSVRHSREDRTGQTARPRNQYNWHGKHEVTHSPSEPERVWDMFGVMNCEDRDDRYHVLSGQFWSKPVELEHTVMFLEQAVD